MVGGDRMDMGVVGTDRTVVGTDRTLVGTDRTEERFGLRGMVGFDDLELNSTAVCFHKK